MLSSSSTKSYNWNTMQKMQRMIMYFMCGALMSFTTLATAATTAAVAGTDDMQAAQKIAVVSNQIPGNCSLVKCPPVEVCPEDSYRLPSLVEPKKQGSHHQGGSCCPSTSSHKCQCIPDLLCAPKECPLGWLAHVSKNATGKPGECCPKFQCFPSGSGETKGNHPHYQHEQPHYNPPEKLHGAPYHPSSADINFDSSDIGLNLGGSSSIEDEEDEDEDDDSLDDDDSAEDLLDTNNAPQHQKLLQHQPLNDADDGHCFHDGKIYKSGGSWTVQSECSQCFCNHGLVSCKPITCDMPAECRLARVQPLSCCPVCDGCVSASGKAYNMSEVWQEDPCTNCTCQGGRIQCHVSMCKRQHSCANPKHYAGECCPRCESEPPDTGHPHPISHDKDSCPFRDCHRDISCPNGFRLDKSGCPTCECQKCQSLLGCKLSCSKGFKVDTFGCTLCDCRGSEDNNLIFPPFSSSSSRSRSENNIEANHHEISSPSGSLDQSSSSSIFSGGKLDQRNLLGNSGSNNNNKDLFGRDGHQYHHQYHDGNRYHRPHPHQHTHHNVVDNGNDDGSYNYGYDSNEARSSSSLASGGGGSGASTSVLVVLCTVDSDGVRRMEGEEWSDHCRRCVCRNGKEMCSLITCQAPKCEHPIFYPGDCCPRCPVEETSVSFNQVNISVCLSTDGTERVEGEIWTLSSCLTCTCHSGQVLCAAPDCPPTPCSNPKLVDCCLKCSGNSHQDKDGEHSDTGLQTSSSSSSYRNCLSDDSIRTYLDGETWKVGACQSCRCVDGQIQCFSAGKCPPLECPRPVLAKNQCCPICLSGRTVHKPIGQQHHGVEGFDLHRVHGKSNDIGDNIMGHEHHEPSSSLTHGTVTTSTTTTSRGPGGGLEPHCAVLIACLLVVTILLSLYIVRQVCFHRRVSRRLIKKVPVGFHSSSSHSPSVTPDCCYKCDYSKYCDSGGCVIVGGGGGGGSCTTSGVGGSGGSRSSGGVCGGSSRASSTNGSDGHLSSEQKPLFQNSDHLDHQSVSSSVIIPSTPTPPPPGLTESLLRDSDKV